MFGDWEAQVRRIMKLIAGGGLSITGSHNMCGDYLYSGHTVMLTLTYLFIKEYSPRRLWWYHWICWLLSVIGIFCILLAHDHYTVDVVVAYYITTRLFWWYHTMANQQPPPVIRVSSQFSLCKTTLLTSHGSYFRYRPALTLGFFIPSQRKKYLFVHQRCERQIPLSSLIPRFSFKQKERDSGNLWSSTTQGPMTTQSSPITHTPEPPPFQNFSGYFIGVGRADCTGQVSDINLMGYGKSGQNARGLLTRLYSRAFILADPDGSNRMAFVSVELGMISQRLRLEVLKRLQSKYGSLYRRDNVILSGTHTHSGPAGFFQNTLYILASEGFSNRTFQYIVSGIMKSIEIAHTNLKPGKIFINKGNVAGVQINRSPSSYLQNPASERARYSTNTDTEMVVLKMVGLNGEDLGLISWFAIHPVSMNNSNHFVNSDNMGYAAYLFEQEKNRGYLPGQGPFVAGFASSNLGDVSPNIRGPHCINTGESCDNEKSTCPIGGFSIVTSNAESMCSSFNYEA
ncbi:hypothetical protein STEG23_020917 [Scotinomys teguina]